MARVHPRFLLILPAPEVDADNAARERLDPVPSPAVEDENVTSSSADILPLPRRRRCARAASRPRTPAPVVQSSAEVETPTELRDAVNVTAQSGQATGARKNGSTRIELGTNAATMVLMRVKEESVEMKLAVEEEVRY